MAPEQEIVLSTKLTADVGDFDRNMAKGDKAIERQAKALDDHAKALDKEVQALKKAEQPNLAQARALQIQAKEARAASQALLQKTTVVQQATSASKAHYAALLNVETGMKGATLATRGFQAALASVSRTLAPLLALFAGAAIVRAADDFKSFSGQVANATRETKDAAAVQRELLGIAGQTGAKLATTVDVFRRIQLGAKDLGKSNQDVLQVVETVQKLGVIGRASTEAMNAGLLQFGQAMATGRVYAEEFNSVVENLPIVAEEIARGLGMTVGQLKLAVKEGKISSEQFFTAIQDAYERVKEQFANTPVTLAQGFGIFQVQLAQTAGTLDEATGFTDALGRALASLGEGLLQLGVFIKENAGELRSLSEIGYSLITTLGELIRTVVVVGAELLGMTRVGDDAAGMFRGLGSEARNFAELLGEVAIQVLKFTRDVKRSFADLRQNARVIRGSLQGAAVGATVGGAVSGGTLAGLGALAGAGVGGLATAAQGTKTNQAELDAIDDEYTRQVQNIFNAFSKGGNGGAVNNTPGNRTNVSSADKKKKKGRSESSADRDAVRGRVDNMRDNIRDLQIAARDALADLGPFADETDKLALKQQFLNREVAIYNAGLEALRKTTVKTKEGQEAKREAIEDTTRALKENGIEIKQTGNEQLKLADDLDRATASFNRMKKEVQANLTAESVKNRLAYELDALNEAFEAEQITAQQYYDERLALIERNANIEKTVIQTRIDLVKKELDGLRDANADLEKRRQLEIELLRLRGSLVAVDQTRTLDREGLNRDQRQTEREAGKRLKGTFQSGLSEAITAVLTGDKTTNAIAKFASAMKNSLIQAFSDALSQRIVRSFDGVFQQLGGFFNKLSGNQVNLQTSGVPSGALSSTQSALNAAGGGQSGGGGIFSAFSKLFGGGTKAAGASSAASGAGSAAAAGGLSLAGVLGPAAAGGAAGYGIGNAAGSKFGRTTGAIAGYFGGALAGGAIGFALGGPVGAAIGAGIGSIVGAVGGIVGGGKKAKQKEQERKQAKFAAFDSRVNSILSGTDTNNLESIRQGSFAIQRAFKQSGGSRNKEAALASLAELNKARVAREKAIKEYIADIQAQNKDIETEINKIGKNEAQQYFLDQARELREITREREKALEQFKDSEEAKTEILKNEALQRELIAKQEQEAFKDSVEGVRDLLEQRDEVMNANFFRRAKTAEQTKAQQLSELDSQIAEALQGVQEFQKNGTALPEGLAGLDFILKGAAGITTQNINLELIIQEAENIAATKKVVEDALDDFLRKIGATAA